MWPLGGAKDTQPCPNKGEGGERGCLGPSHQSGWLGQWGKERQSRQARRSGVRTEVRLPHLEEGLGPDAEMQ